MYFYLGISLFDLNIKKYTIILLVQVVVNI